MTAATFGLKDSGKREEFDSGMVRDTTEGKVDYTLALDGPMFERYAAHLTKGAQKYDARNWMLAAGEAELERFRQSALRHLLQWLNGDEDEDHAAAVWFNINGAEYVLHRMLIAEDLAAQEIGPGPAEDWRARWLHEGAEEARKANDMAEKAHKANALAGVAAYLSPDWFGREPSDVDPTPAYWAEEARMAEQERAAKDQDAAYEALTEAGCECIYCHDDHDEEPTL